MSELSEAEKKYRDELRQEIIDVIATFIDLKEKQLRVLHAEIKLLGFHKENLEADKLTHMQLLTLIKKVIPETNVYQLQ